MTASDSSTRSRLRPAARAGRSASAPAPARTVLRAMCGMEGGPPILPERIRALRSHRHPPERPMHHDLLFLSATQAAALIRRRKLSPVEYVDAVLGAVSRLQPPLNAFVTVTGERARREAQAAEQAVMAGGELPPLHGVPGSVKDQ